jgi:RNA polymerase sigma-70 factor (ECF subfamily)
MSSVEDHFNLESDYDSIDVEKKDLEEFLQETINKLPERYSVIITLFYLNQLSIEEISEVMHISVSNVKVMLHRSRNALRDLILNSKLAEEII